MVDTTMHHPGCPLREALLSSCGECGQQIAFSWQLIQDPPKQQRAAQGHALPVSPSLMGQKDPPLRPSEGQFLLQTPTTPPLTCHVG